MCAHAPRTWPTHFPSYFDICPVAGPHVSGPGSRQGRVFCSKCEFIKESRQNLKVPRCAIFTVLRNDMRLLSAEKQTPSTCPPPSPEQRRAVKIAFFSGMLAGSSRRLVITPPPKTHSHWTIVKVPQTKKKKFSGGDNK